MEMLLDSEPETLDLPEQLVPELASHPPITVELLLDQVLVSVRAINLATSRPVEKEMVLSTAKAIDSSIPVSCIKSTQFRFHFDDISFDLKEDWVSLSSRAWAPVTRLDSVLETPDQVEFRPLEWASHRQITEDLPPRLELEMHHHWEVNSRLVDKDKVSASANKLFTAAMTSTWLLLRILLQVQTDRINLLSRILPLPLFHACVWTNKM